MGLSRSLDTAASALRSNQTSFDVISNNVANVSTYGYKASRTNFVDELSQVYNYGKSANENLGGTNPYQVGLGVSVGSISYDMTQGDLETTNRSLDLALQGDGYFIYNQNGNEVYSRVAAINKDEDGNLVDSSSGAFLQGYNVNTDENGRIIKNSDGSNQVEASMGNLTIDPGTISAPRQTENVMLSGNLNSDAETGEERSTSIDIYDNLGSVHSLNFNFSKSENENEYLLTVNLDGTEITLPDTQIIFNQDGTLQSPTSINITTDLLNTVTGQNSFDTSRSLNVSLADPNNVLTGITQYSGSSTATAGQQDGYESGSLKDLSVDGKGQIWGAFTNGQSEILGQIVTAKFTNPEALLRTGGNFLDVTPNSGFATYGTAGDAFPSLSVASNRLEASNVDLTTELTSMITTQRAYEAAAKGVTTSDELLQTLINLKR